MTTRSDFIASLEQTEGNGDLERLLALRTYEQNNLHPTAVRERSQKENAFKNIETAYNNNNHESAAMLIKNNQDLLDEEFINDKTKDNNKFKGFFDEVIKMGGTAIESTMNNVFEVTDDFVQVLEKMGVPNLYVTVKDGSLILQLKDQKILILDHLSLLIIQIAWLLI